jgi:hypothetical protein
MNLRDQLRLHLTSLRSAGLLFIEMPVMPDQFRRCSSCKIGCVCSHSPSTALPCPACKGELLVEPIKIDDLKAERKRCADALIRLAATCEANCNPDGMVKASGAASHMRKLAEWMEKDE